MEKKEKCMKAVWLLGQDEELSLDCIAGRWRSSVEGREMTFWKGFDSKPVNLDFMMQTSGYLTVLQNSQVLYRYSANNKGFSLNNTVRFLSPIYTGFSVR